jgi:hypothetical protein
MKPKYYSPQSAPEIIDFEIVDHGVHHPDYFQGCGVALTKFTDCVTGVGFESAADAAEDIREQLSIMGYALPVELENALDALSTDNDVAQSYADCGEDVPEESELVYYVSVRVKVKE